MSVERLCVFTRTKFRLKKVNFGPSVASKMRKNRSEFNGKIFYFFREKAFVKFFQHFWDF